MASKYNVKQWRYVPTAAYGGPKVDEETLDVSAVAVSADRRKIDLWVDGMEPICAGLISGSALVGIGNAIVNVLI